MDSETLSKPPLSETLTYFIDLLPCHTIVDVPTLNNGPFYYRVRDDPLIVPVLAV